MEAPLNFDKSVRQPNVSIRILYNVKAININYLVINPENISQKPYN